MRSLQLAWCPIEPPVHNWNIKGTECHQGIQKEIIELSKVTISNILALLDDHGPVSQVLLLTLLGASLVFEVTQSEHEIAQCCQQLFVNRR